MQLFLSDIEEIKSLVTMKLNTYASRIMDLIICCKHPYNLIEIANKLDLEFSDKSISKNEVSANMELVRELLKIELKKYRDAMGDEISNAEHPHALADISSALDKLI